MSCILRVRGGCQSRISMENETRAAHVERVMTTDWPQITVAVGTWAVAGFTWWLVNRHVSIAKEQAKIQLYLQLRKEFDSEYLDAAKSLARQLLDDAPHEDINETVMNFFEDMGMLLRRDYLDREMIWDTFGYYARMWWSSCRAYIVEERTRLNDNTLFTDFEYLVERICEDDVRRRRKTRAELEPSPSNINGFLKDAARP
jgi:hypothetical protein